MMGDDDDIDLDGSAYQILDSSVADVSMMSAWSMLSFRFMTFIFAFILCQWESTVMPVIDRCIRQI